MVDHPKENAKHPDSLHKPSYPYNHSTVTRSGHQMDVDDTPGQERLKYAHTSGTYYEMGPDGRLVMGVVGKAWYNYADGFTSTVAGQSDLKIGANENINVDKNSNKTIGGDMFISAGGDSTLGIGGNSVELIRKDYHRTVDGDRQTRVGGNESLNVAGETMMAYDKSTVTNVGKDMTLTVGESVEFQAYKGAGNFHIKTNIFFVEAQVIEFRASGSVIKMDKGGNIYIQSANKVYINSGDPGQEMKKPK